MIRHHDALLRHAQDFFLSDLVGLYTFDEVRIAAPELRETIPPNIDYRKRRQLMEERQGKGKYLEQVRIKFGPWEIMVYSSVEKPPLGEVVLRDEDSRQEYVTGPLDPATWSKIGKFIRSETHQRKAS